jgi:hypothetical protein
LLLLLPPVLLLLVVVVEVPLSTLLLAGATCLTALYSDSL